METTPGQYRYSDLEKEELIEQWKQSGKNKSIFCKEQGVSYYSFNDWIKRRDKKKQKAKTSFVSLKIKNSQEPIFTQLVLKNGITVNIFHRVEANYLATLLKA